MKRFRLGANALLTGFEISGILTENLSEHCKLYDGHQRHIRMQNKRFASILSLGVLRFPGRSRRIDGHFYPSSPEMPAWD